MAVQVSTRRFTVEEYHKMADAGILEEDDRVELLDGEIVLTAPIGSRHAACADRPCQLCVERAEPSAPGDEPSRSGPSISLSSFRARCR